MSANDAAQTEPVLPRGHAQRDIQSQAQRLDRSLSWGVQQAWKNRQGGAAEGPAVADDMSTTTPPRRADNALRHHLWLGARRAPGPFSAPQTRPVSGDPTSALGHEDQGGFAGSAKRDWWAQRGEQRPASSSAGCRSLGMRQTCLAIERDHDGHSARFQRDRDREHSGPASSPWPTRSQALPRRWRPGASCPGVQVPAENWRPSSVAKTTVAFPNSSIWGPGPAASPTLTSSIRASRRRGLPGRRKPARSAGGIRIAAPPRRCPRMATGSIKELGAGPAARFQVDVGSRRIAGAVDQLENRALRKHPGRAQVNDANVVSTRTVGRVNHHVSPRRARAPAAAAGAKSPRHVHHRGHHVLAGRQVRRT